MQNDAHRARLNAETRYWALATTAVLVYSTVLLFAYRDLISPRYDYLPYRTPSWSLYAASVGLTILLVLILPRRIRRPSDFVQWLLFLLAQAPMILLSQYMDRLTPGDAIRFSLVVAGCTVLIRAGATAHPPWRRGIAVPAHRANTVWLALALFALAVYAVLVVTVGISTTWLSLDDVYVVRADFAADITPVPYIGYLIPVLANVVNPAFIARGAYSLRWPWLLLGAGGQFLIYLTTGQKAVLLSVPAILAVAWLFRRNLRPRGTSLLVGVAATVFVTLAVDTALSTNTWTDLFTRRFMIIPGGFAIIWTDVFGGGPHGNYTSTPGIGYLFGTSPFPRGASFYVGESLTGNSATNANVNFFGEGFYEHGYAGMLVATLILILLLWAFDWSCRGLPTSVAALMLVMPTVAISSAGIFTVITSHGIPATIVVCALLPRTGWGRRSTQAATLAHPPPLRA